MREGSGSVDDYRHIAELAKSAGVAVKTARRYVKAFPEQFSGETFGRTTRYPPAAVDALRRIADLYAQGLGTKEVRKRLIGRDAEVPVMALPAPGPDQMALQGIRQELAGLRDEVGRLTCELAGARGEIGRLARELAEAREAAGRLEVRVSGLGQERREHETRQETRLAALEALQGPSQDFMRLPLVFKSEQGDFLGVSDKETGQHFSLRDFVYLIHRNAGQRKDVDTTWRRLGCAGWRMVIQERAPLTGRRKSHHADVERFTTPMGNLVARLVSLCFDGQDMPPFLVYELFRQIGRDFS